MPETQPQASITYDVYYGTSRLAQVKAGDYQEGYAKALGLARNLVGDKLDVSRVRISDDLRAVSDLLRRGSHHS